MTTLIKGGMVYDGSGGPAREADVLIEGNAIVRVEPRQHRRVDEVIDAKGLIVTPGFVDAVNYHDHYAALFSDPAGTELVIRGITTIVAGHGGASLAPLRAHGGAPEAWWGGAAPRSTHLTTFEELFGLLRGRLGVNFGSLVGYSTVREGILRGETRDCTDREFEVFEETLEKALTSGALGVSVNLEYPGTSRAPRHELTACAAAAGRHNRIVAIRLRTRGERLREAFKEVLAIVGDTRSLITDLEPYRTHELSYRELLGAITKESAEHDLAFATTGAGEVAIPLALLLPPHLRSSRFDEMCEKLEDPAARDETRSYLGKYREFPIAIATLGNPSLKLFEGTPFHQWSIHEHVPFEDALIRLMRASSLRGVLVAKVAERELADIFVSHDRALIASGEVAAPALERAPHLGLLAAARRDRLPIEQLVAKMTGMPARILNLPRRGLVRDGYYADIAVIDLQKRAVREVMVNGIRAVTAGAPTGGRGGRTLTGDD